MPQWLITISPLLNLVAVLALLYLIYEYRFPLNRRLEKIQDRVARTEAGLVYLGQLFKALMPLLGTVFNIFHRQGVLTLEEFEDIQRRYFALIETSIEASLRQFVAKGNPLGLEESDRLKRYIEKAKQGMAFSPEEIEDYQDLVAKLEKEHPSDPGLWPLVALGAFLFGLYLGTKAGKQGASR